MSFEDVGEARVASDSNDNDEVLDVEGAAKFLKASQDWVYKESAAGRIPHSKLGRKKRFLRSELLAWMRKGGTNQGGQK